MTLKIAVIAPSRHHFGNVLTQLPLLVGLKTHYSQCHITLWSTTSMSEKLIVNQGADSTINFSQWNPITFLKEFNSHHYDIVFNLRSGSDRIHFLIGALSNAQIKYGLSNKWYYRYLYDEFLPILKGDTYIAKTHLKLLNTICEQPYSTDIVHSVSTQSSLKSLNQDCLTILPGGGAGDYKRWPIENFITCCSELAQSTSNIKRIVFILGPDEKQFNSLIPTTLENLPIEVLNSPSVETMIDIASQTRLAISNDCGPAHIFQMMKSPMIMIWGSKSNQQLPFDTLKEWFYPHEHSWAIVPNDEHRSIHSITCNKVYSVARAQLDRP